MDSTVTILIVGWIFVIVWVPIVIATNRKTHPSALFVLFGAEMWERFSYYGMRALLTLYMTKVLFVEMGQGAADTRALGIYGSYTSMVYLFPVIGGLLADRVLGFRRSIMWGGIVMIFGHLSLAIMGMAGLEDNLTIFFMALAMIIVGNAFFKPNIASFLGDFYEQNDPRKDGAFTLFYMGVNIGSFLAILTCGYIGERINWHYGFGLAGIGMTLGLIVFSILGPRVFGKKGLKPNRGESVKSLIKGVKNETLIYIGTILFLPICASLHNLNDLMSTSLLIMSLGMIGYMLYESWRMDNSLDGKRLLVAVLLFFFHAIFWALFEQAGGSLTLFVDRHVDRHLFGSEIPASIFQSLNPLFIILLAPLFSTMWVRMRNTNVEPNTPLKFVLGLVQLGLGFLVIVLAAAFVSEAMVPAVVIMLALFFHTTGELTLSPVGLSMITKLSPAKIVGFTMGFWYLSFALGNKLAGEIGKLTAAVPNDVGILSTQAMFTYTSTYLTWGVYVVFGAAAVLLFLVPTLKKWMGGIH